ncbi:MAG: hypothetical protein RIM99_02175 [Cyclobacteriaceae bacterium]
MAPKKTILGLVFLTLIFFVSGQRKYGQGFIVMNNGDTINGEVQVRFEDQNFESCIFKSMNSREERKYSTEEISGFGFTNGRLYLSGEGLNIEERAGHFLEYMVSGEVQLFFSEDYFVIFEEAIIRLTKENYVEKVGGLVVKNCLSMVREAAKIKLDHKSMTDFFVKFNDCLGSESNRYYIPVPATSLNLLAGAGISSLSFSEKDELTNHLNESNYSSTENVKFVLGYQRQLPELNDRMKAGVELLTTYVVYEAGYKTENAESNTQSIRSSRLENISVTPRLGLSYTPKLFNSDFEVNAGVGLRIPVVFNQTHKGIEVDQSNGTITNIDPTNLQYSKSEGVVMIGITRNVYLLNSNLLLDLSYQRGLGYTISDTTGKKNSTSGTLCFAVGYRLNLK